MRKVATLSNEERQELFQATALKMGMRPEVIEKDFWVCFMLDHLFHFCEYKDAFVFKGGTSLSKAYHIIERFSEDIDLILDWRKIIKDGTDPWEKRSKTKQDQFNKQINKDAADFYRDILVPVLNKELSLVIGDEQWIEVDDADEMTPVCFDFIEYLKPQLKDWVICFDSLGSSRCGYLSADTSIEFKLKKLFNEEVNTNKENCFTNGEIIFSNILENKHEKLENFTLTSLSKRAEILDYAINKIKLLLKEKDINPCDIISLPHHQFIREWCTN